MKEYIFIEVQMQKMMTMVTIINLQFVFYCIQRLKQFVSTFIGKYFRDQLLFRIENILTLLLDEKHPRHPGIG